MENYTIEKDEWGQNMIFVGKCRKYEYEEQNPELSEYDLLIMSTDFEE